MSRRIRVTALCAAMILLLLGLAPSAQALPGDLTWAHTIGTAISQASFEDVAGGPKGAVAAAGWQKLPGGRTVPLVAKYTADGLQWARTYEGPEGGLPGPAGAQAVAFDKLGNICVAATLRSDSYADGTLVKVDYDILLLKYDPDGALLWAVRYDDGAGDSDQAAELAIDKAGDLIVVGTRNVLDDWRQRFLVPAVIVLKYDADGRALWPAAGYYEPAAGDATFRTFELASVALDKTGDVYVSGDLYSTWYRLKTLLSGQLVKFSSADGTLVATQTDQCSPGTESRFGRIAVRGSRLAIGGLVIELGDTGAPSGSHGLVATFDLDLQPVDRYDRDAADTRWEQFQDVEMDARGDVYVTGDRALSEPAQSRPQAVSLELSPDLSTVLWKAVYAPVTGDADGYLIARDTNGDVYVAGVQRTATSDYMTGDFQDFLLIKYGSSGERQWVRTWSAGGSGYDGPAGLVLGAKRDVFVGGRGWAGDGAMQAAMLRYRD